jgi:hypothetical protein
MNPVTVLQSQAKALQHFPAGRSQWSAVGGRPVSDEADEAVTQCGTMILKSGKCRARCDVGSLRGFPASRSVRREPRGPTIREQVI